MTPTQALHESGQSIWLDNITRDILNDGTLRRYRDELQVSGLTSNPTIFNEAIGGGRAYDDDIRTHSRHGLTGEELFLELALADLRRAADLFLPIHERTAGRDGWVSLEVSPWLARDARATLASALHIHRRAERPNLYVKIPGTPEGIGAIEEAIAAGVPVNVTLLFSAPQYRAAAEAYLRGIERRVAAGLDPRISSVASLFVSRWDRAVAGKVPEELRNRLGVAVAMQTYRVHCELQESPRWRTLAQSGAPLQRLLWASTGVKEPRTPADLYVRALAAPDTIDTMPEKTLLAFSERGGAPLAMRRDGGDAEKVLQRFEDAGVDTTKLARDLQAEGEQSFIQSWQQLLGRIAEKGAALATT